MTDFSKTIIGLDIEKYFTKDEDLFLLNQDIELNGVGQVTFEGGAMEPVHFTISEDKTTLSLEFDNAPEQNRNVDIVNTEGVPNFLINEPDTEHHLSRVEQNDIDFETQLEQDLALDEQDQKPEMSETKDLRTELSNHLNLDSQNIKISGAERQVVPDLQIGDLTGTIVAPKDGVIGQVEFVAETSDGQKVEVNFENQNSFYQAIEKLESLDITKDIDSQIKDIDGVTNVKVIDVDKTADNLESAKTVTDKTTSDVRLETWNDVKDNFEKVLDVKLGQDAVGDKDDLSKNILHSNGVNCKIDYIVKEADNERGFSYEINLGNGNEQFTIVTDNPDNLKGFKDIIDDFKSKASAPDSDLGTKEGLIAYIDYIDFGHALSNIEDCGANFKDGIAPIPDGFESDVKEYYDKTDVKEDIIETSSPRGSESKYYTPEYSVDKIDDYVNSIPLVPRDKFEVNAIYFDKEKMEMVFGYNYIDENKNVLFEKYDHATPIVMNENSRYLNVTSDITHATTGNDIMKAFYKIVGSYDNSGKQLDYDKGAISSTTDSAIKSIIADNQKYFLNNVDRREENFAKIMNRVEETDFYKEIYVSMNSKLADTDMATALKEKTDLELTFNKEHIDHFGNLKAEDENDLERLKNLNTEYTEMANTTYEQMVTTFKSDTAKGTQKPVAANQYRSVLKTTLKTMAFGLIPVVGIPFLISGAVNLVINLPVILISRIGSYLKNCIIGNKVEITDSNGEKHTVRVRLSPAELRGLMFKDYAAGGRAERKNLFKEFLSYKAMAKLTGESIKDLSEVLDIGKNYIETESTKQIENTPDNVDIQENDLKDLQENVDDAKKDLKEAKDNLDKSKEKLESLKEKVEKGKDKSDTEKKTDDKKTDKKKDSDEKKNADKNKDDKSESKSNESKNENVEQNTSNKTDKVDTQKNTEKSSFENKSIESQINDLKNELKSLKAEIEKIKAEQKDVDKEIKSLENQINDAEKKLDSIDNPKSTDEGEQGETVQETEPETKESESQVEEEPETSQEEPEEQSKTEAEPQDSQDETKTDEVQDKTSDNVESQEEKVDETSLDKSEDIATEPVETVDNGVEDSQTTEIKTDNDTTDIKTNDEAEPQTNEVETTKTFDAKSIDDKINDIKSRIEKCGFKELADNLGREIKSEFGFNTKKGLESDKQSIIDNVGKYQQLVVDNKSLNNVLDKLGEVKTQLESEKENAESKLSNIKADISKNYDKINDLKSRLSNVEKNNPNIDKNIQDIKADINNLISEKKETIEKIKDLDESIKSIESLMDTLDPQEKQDKLEEKEKLETEKNNLENHNKDLDKSINDKHNDLNKLESSKKSIDNLKNKIEKAEKKNNSLEQKQEKVENKIQDIDSKIESNKNDINQTNKDIEKNASKAESLKNDINSKLESRQNDLKNFESKQNDRAEAYANDRAEVRDAINDVNKEISNLDKNDPKNTADLNKLNDLKAELNKRDFNDKMSSGKSNAAAGESQSQSKELSTFEKNVGLAMSSGIDLTKLSDFEQQNPDVTLTGDNGKLVADIDGNKFEGKISNDEGDTRFEVSSINGEDVSKLGIEIKDNGVEATDSNNDKQRIEKDDMDKIGGLVDALNKTDVSDDTETDNVEVDNDMTDKSEDEDNHDRQDSHDDRRDNDDIEFDL